MFGYFFNTQISKSRKQTIFFEELNKLSIDSILVHSEYGLCKFNNIRKIELNDSIHECLESVSYTHLTLPTTTPV